MIEQLLVKSSKPKHNKFHRKQHRSNDIGHFHFNTVALWLEALHFFTKGLAFAVKLVLHAYTRLAIPP